MASIDDIIGDLTRLEKSSYKDVTDVALKQFSERNVTMQILEKFFTARYNRESAVYEAVNTKYRTGQITDSYSVFRTIQTKISGKNDDLDDMNGVLNQNVYGEASRQRERRRTIAELGKRGAAMTRNVISRFSTYKQKIEDLQGKLT